MTRICTICEYEGPEEDFSVTRVVKGRKQYNGRCRPCYNLYYKERRLARGAAALVAERAVKLKRQYGMTLEDFDTLLKRQEYKCAICGKHSDDHYRSFDVDHNHITGQVRGLLCGHCNKGIGHLSADTTLSVLESALAYMKRCETK